MQHPMLRSSTIRFSLMQASSTKRATVLRWLAGMHSIHAVLVAVASFGAILPTVRFCQAPSVVHVDMQNADASEPDEDDRDRSQNQDQDTDQDQDRDVSDLSKLFMASEKDDLLAPELVLILRCGVACVTRRDAVASRNAAQATYAVALATPRPVYTRTCRLML